MSTYTPISSQTISSAIGEITFTGIPQTYTDLVLIVNATQSSGPNQTFFRVGNGTIDTGSNYSNTFLYGNGTSAASTRVSNDTKCYFDYTAAPGISGDPNIVIAHFMNYSNTTTNKTILQRAGKATNGTDAIVSLWRSTSAINTIRVYLSSGNFNTGSTFTLYGIGAGSPKAFGGDEVRTDGTYWYHTYRSSGIFAPMQSLSCDYLVVAGGGGSGKPLNLNGGSGGGGAGGYRESSMSLSAGTTHTVTIGGGGSGAASTAAAGSVGSNSVFSTITSSGGGGGGSHSTGTPRNGTTGGSGGGGAGTAGTSGTGGSGNSGGYSPVEGYAGGNGLTDGATYDNGGGGGGASQAGSNATSAGGGNSGNGTTSSISGTSVARAGGGAGGGYTGKTNGTAGTGGTAVTTNGAANTGAGAGGAGANAGTNSFNGGSGVVIVRYAV